MVFSTSATSPVRSGFCCSLCCPAGTAAFPPARPRRTGAGQRSRRHAGEFVGGDRASLDVPPRRLETACRVLPIQPTSSVTPCANRRYPGSCWRCPCRDVAALEWLDLRGRRGGPAPAVVRAFPETATDARSGGDGRCAVEPPAPVGTTRNDGRRANLPHVLLGLRHRRPDHRQRGASYLAFVFRPKLLLAAVALAAAGWRGWRVFIAFSGLVAVGLPDAAQRRGPREPQVHQRLADRRQRVRRLRGSSGSGVPGRRQSGVPGSHRGRCPRGDHRGRRRHRPDPREEPVDAASSAWTATRSTNGCGRRRPRVPCSSPTSMWSTRSSWQAARSTYGWPYYAWSAGYDVQPAGGVVSRRPGRAKPSPCRRAAARAGDRLRRDRRRDAPAVVRSEAERGAVRAVLRAGVQRRRFAREHRRLPRPGRFRVDRRAPGCAGREHVRRQRNGRARQLESARADSRSRAAARSWSPTPATTGCSASHRTAT